MQSFDLEAVESLKNNPYHQQIDAVHYAAPLRRGAAVDRLDITVLSALEIDLDFNVNVLTGSDGVIRGAIGGHQDSSAGAACAVIVAPMLRSRISTVVERVSTLVTPGETVDVLVTDQGIAVNPRREDLQERLAAAGLPLTTMETLMKRAQKMAGRPEKSITVIMLSAWLLRDGTVIDRIRQLVKIAAERDL